jgi:transaldolase
LLKKTYLQWLSSETVTEWWNDSGSLPEISLAQEQGAVSVTTNPVLINQIISLNRDTWRDSIDEAVGYKDKSEKALQLTGVVVKKISSFLYPIYEKSRGELGCVCSQVNPALAGDREAMLVAAVKMSAFGKNVFVKLPATAAGLDVMEECILRGINVTVTVSFTVPQVLAIATRHRKAIQKAEQAGNTPGKCFAVIMIGRLDDYIRDAALDMQANIDEADIRSAGLAVAKRAYKIYKQENYEAKLMVAAMRGIYHVTDLAGADLVLSIHPKYQALLADPALSKEQLIDKPVAPQSISKLMKIPEFVKAYEPDGMDPSEFISFGAEQRTLTQFSEVGWKMLEGFEV